MCVFSRYFVWKLYHHFSLSHLNGRIEWWCSRIGWKVCKCKPIPAYFRSGMRTKWIGLIASKIPADNILSFWVGAGVGNDRQKFASVRCGPMFFATNDYHRRIEIGVTKWPESQWIPADYTGASVVVEWVVPQKSMKILHAISADVINFIVCEFSCSHFAGSIGYLVQPLGSLLSAWLAGKSMKFVHRSFLFWKQTHF